MARKYSIPIPYRTSFWDSAEIRIGLGLPEVQSALKRLPAPLVAKLKSVSPAHPVEFSKSDFDSIPDDLWAKLAPRLG